MPKFSEPELYLIENWTDSRLLEDAMKSIRTKYAEMIDDVVEQVQKNHRELHAFKIYFSRDRIHGEVGVGKEKWPKGPYDWPSGFFIGNLQLENVTAPDLEAPYKGVWIYDVKKETEQRLRKAAERILDSDECRRLEFDDDDSKPERIRSGVNRRRRRRPLAQRRALEEKNEMVSIFI